MRIFFRRHYTWVLVALILISCGRLRERFGRIPGGHTNLTIQFPNYEPTLLSWPFLYGGVMIYVVGISGTGYATSIPMDLAGQATGTATISLPNGTYKVYALGWEGPTSGQKLAAQVGCYIDPNSHTLNGTSETANIVIGKNEANCNFTTGGPFANVGYITTGTNFPSLNVYPCNGLTTMACSTLSPSYNSMSSVKVVAEGFVKTAANVQQRREFGIEGVCQSFSGSVFSTNSRIPPGATSGQEKFLATTLEFYPNNNTTCSGAPSTSVFFPNGLANGSSTNASLVTNSGVYVNVGP